MYSQQNASYILLKMCQNIISNPSEHAYRNSIFFGINYLFILSLPLCISSIHYHSSTSENHRRNAWNHTNVGVTLSYGLQLRWIGLLVLSQRVKVSDWGSKLKFKNLPHVEYLLLGISSIENIASHVQSKQEKTAFLMLTSLSVPFCKFPYTSC